MRHRFLKYYVYFINVERLVNLCYFVYFSRCWVKDDKEGWIGATVEDKSTEGKKVIIKLKTEKDDVSFITFIPDIL